MMSAELVAPTQPAPTLRPMKAPEGLSRVHVVIVNWNLPEDTIACAVSLAADGFDPAAIWVIDNGSTDGSAKRLVAGLPASVHLIETGSNLGFAGGNNIGINAALAAGAEWVFLLNNDTLVRPGMRRALEHALAQVPDVRLMSPLVLYEDDPRRVWSMGDRRLPGTLLTRGLLRNRLLGPAHVAALPEVLPVDFLTACALLVHREVWQRIGLLDDRYFMYAEDADYCLRAAVAGYRLACATRAVVLHKVSRSSGIHSPAARLWRSGNMARFYRDHARGPVRALMFGFSFARTTLLGLMDIARGRFQLARAGLRGWHMGWFGDSDVPIGTPGSLDRANKS